MKVLKILNPLFSQSQQESYKPVGTLFFLSFCLLLFCYSSCKEEQEGCTDITATNWAADADKSCEDCCVFPLLKIRFTNVYGDTTFRLGELYKDEMDNVFSINSLRYYISDVSLIGINQNYVVSDSIRAIISIAGDSTSTNVHDDVAFVTTGVPSYNIGTIKPNDEFIEGVNFHLGVAQPLNSIIPTSVVSNHPLSPKADSMYWDENRGYIFHRIEIFSDTIATDTILLEIGGDDVLTAIQLPFGESATSGVDLTIPVTVDYKCWFKGINFADDSAETMKAKIVDNMANCFSLTE